MFEIIAYRGRTSDYSGKIYETDGTTGVTLQSTDLLRFKIGRGSSVPLLDLSSEESSETSDAGSGITVDSTAAPAAYTIRLAQGDLTNIPAGAYDCELSVVDDSETTPPDAIKLIERGVIHVIDSLGGDVGK